MKRKIVTAVMVAVATVIFGSVNGAFALPVVWQIGQPDGSVDKAWNAAQEFSPDGLFSIVFDYAVDAGSPIDLSPTFPGYMGPVNVSDPLIGAPDDDRPATHTSNMFNITFTLGDGYYATELIYGRYGSESDVLWLNGDLVDVTGTGTEGGFNEFVYDLGALPGGEYTLSVAYWGGGAVNGHYIDYIQMTGAHAPEPATMVLFGVGLVGLVGLRRTKLFKRG